MIDTICEANHAKKPRIYRNKAHMEYLNFAKCKHRDKKKTRTAIRQQMQYIRRDLARLDSLMESYGELPENRWLF